jgi:DNA (cytosine-5)-methyltransferase 1
VDIVSAGFPCQPYSVAGKRDGEKDERNLWPDTIRIIREVGAEQVFLENVPGLLADGYARRIYGELAESGDDIEWDCISASAVGAWHRRERLWVLAHAHEAGLEGRDGEVVRERF